MGFYIFLSRWGGTSAAYNDKQRRVPFLIKNQLRTLTVRINLIGLTAGGGGSCKTLTGVDTSRLELTCRSLSREEDLNFFPSPIRLLS